MGRDERDDDAWVEARVAAEQMAREAAEAFVNFLFTQEAQEIFAEYGLRSVDPEVAKATASQYPPVADQFSIEAQFNGWEEATPKFFGDTGLFTQAMAELGK